MDPLVCQPRTTGVALTARPRDPVSPAMVGRYEYEIANNALSNTPLVV